MHGHLTFLLIYPLAIMNDPVFGRQSRQLPLEIIHKILQLVPSTQDYFSLGQAALVSKRWRNIINDPYLWKDFILPIHSYDMAEDFLSALTMGRYDRVTSTRYVSDNLLSKSDIRYGLQTKVETMTNIPPNLLHKARKLLCTSAHKIKLHQQIKDGHPRNQIHPYNPYKDFSKHVTTKNQPCYYCYYFKCYCSYAEI